MKMWGILIHLGRNLYAEKKVNTVLEFDESVWNKVADRCAEKGINTIILDVGEGVVYPSHPELAIEGSWTPEKVKSEVLRLRKMGVEVVPKLNFSAFHDAWLQEYGRMVSTSVYYKVCKELIEDAYEMFCHPSIIHIGMDEEDQTHLYFRDVDYITIIRHDELFVHDVNYFAECIEALGATCHMWHDPMVVRNPEHMAKISGSVIPEVWMYYSYIRENWTPLCEQTQFVQDYYKNHFKNLYGYEIEYVEEDPFVVNTKALVEKFALEKRPFVATTSNYEIDHSEVDTVRFLKQLDPKFETVCGVTTAPWRATVAEFEADLLDAVEKLAEAKKIAEE